MAGLGTKTKLKFLVGKSTKAHSSRGSRQTKSNGSVGEMAKTGGHMILSGNTVFKAEFHNQKFTQRWAGRTVLRLSKEM